MKYKKYFLSLVSLLILVILGLFFTYRTSSAQEATIIVNEFLPNPEGKDSEGEWIELFNSSNESVNLSGWFLDDIEGGSKAYEIPLGTLIAPNSYLIFNIQDTKINLNNTGDSVRLLDSQKMVADYVEYASEAKDDVAYALFENIWQWTDIPTPGASNKVLQTANIESPITSSKIEQNSNDIKTPTITNNTNNTQKVTEQKNEDVQELSGEKFSAQISTNSTNKKELFVFIIVTVISIGAGFGFVFIKKHKRMPPQ